MAETGTILWRILRPESHLEKVSSLALPLEVYRRGSSFRGGMTGLRGNRVEKHFCCQSLKKQVTLIIIPSASP